MLESTMTRVSFRRIGRVRKVTEPEHTRRRIVRQPVGHPIRTGERANRAIVPRHAPATGEWRGTAQVHRSAGKAYPRATVSCYGAPSAAARQENAELPADPRMLEMLSYHRDAELYGAWLWTERIRDLADGRIVRDVTAPSRPALHLASDADPA